jgi:Mg-chelatase subunit ChlD
MRPDTRARVCAAQAVERASTTGVKSQGRRAASCACRAQWAVIIKEYFEIRYSYLRPITPNVNVGHHLKIVMKEIFLNRSDSSKFPLLLAVLILCLAAMGVAAQSGRQKEGAQTTASGGTTVDEEELIHVRTEEVLVPVSVRDQAGMSVNGLSADKFFVYDNGERQEISSFNRQRVPANIVLLLDASGSVFSRMRFIREAAKGFLKGLLPEDKVCVMQFADEVELLQEWTGGADTQHLLKALEWRYHPGQATTFYDGLYLAAQEQLKRVQGRKIVILLTDGIDTAAKRRASYADAMNAVRRAEASVYVISLTESLRAALEKHDHGWVGKVFGGYDPKALARYKRLVDEAEKSL